MWLASFRVRFLRGRQSVCRTTVHSMLGSGVINPREFESRLYTKFGSMVEWLQRHPVTVRSAGSSPVIPANSALVQLVRMPPCHGGGSWVRVPYAPQISESGGMVDAGASKASGVEAPCGFESHLSDNG